MKIDVKKIRLEFSKVSIPEGLAKAVSNELAVLDAQLKIGHGVMPTNNVTYASVCNLRKYYKQCTDGNGNV